MSKASAISFRLFYTLFTLELSFHVPILTSSLVYVLFFLFLIFSWGHVFDYFLTLGVFLVDPLFLVSPPFALENDDSKHCLQTNFFKEYLISFLMVSSLIYFALVAF